jgi:hypothetical protein
VMEELGWLASLGVEREDAISVRFIVHAPSFAWMCQACRCGLITPESSYPLEKAAGRNGTFPIVNSSADLALTEVAAEVSGSSLAQLQYMGRDAQKWEIVRMDTTAK